jgi:hypothetical protein
MQVTFDVTTSVGRDPTMTKEQGKAEVIAALNGQMTEALCGHSFSGAASGSVNKKLDMVLRTFAERRLTEAYPYLILDPRCAAGPHYPPAGRRNAVQPTDPTRAAGRYRSLTLPR